MFSTKRNIAPDALAVFVILAAGVVISWPIITGGYLTYMDNPVHLAEVYAMSSEARDGWSDIAFCGFPISTLHSPLWYGVLFLLVQTGLSAGFVYVVCMVFGFLAPAMAFYYVARRYAGVMPSAIFAYILLIQHPVIVGIGSALGGMWTFYIAAAALILLVDRLARPCRSGRDLAWTAGLTGFALLSHLFTVVPLVLLAVLHVWLTLERKREALPTLLAQLAAALVGLMASAAYWLPKVTAGEHGFIIPQDLTPQMVLARFLVPTRMLDLLNGHLPSPSLGLILGALPMLLLIGSGLAGTILLRRRKDDAPLYGAVLAAAIMILLCVIAPEFNIKILGPVAWRTLYFARIGLCFAALPLVAWVDARAGFRLKRSVAIGVAGTAVFAAVWWGSPLRSIVPARDGVEMSEVRGLWEWLKKNRSDDWGRVYLQDTFTRPGGAVRLKQSHVLALTARETGVRQLGPGYGAVPYRTAIWSPSEFQTLYRRSILDEEDEEYLLAMTALTNVTHVVVSDTLTAKSLSRSRRFRPEHQAGRFRVFRVLNYDSRWGTAASGSVSAEVAEFGTGRIVLRVNGDHGGGDFVVKTAYHRNWRLKGGTGARIEASDLGLIEIRGIEPGLRQLVLEYVDPSNRYWLSAAGWVMIIGLVFLPPQSWRRRAKIGIENFTPPV